MTSNGFSGEFPLLLRGYLKNSGFYHFSDQGLFANFSEVHMDCFKEYGDKGEMELRIIYQHVLQPLDPFETLKENSAVDRTVRLGFFEILDNFAFINGEFLSFNDIEEWLGYISYSSIYPKEEFFLDRALLKLYFSKMDLYIGKQVISWGTGYGFNPTDIWNMKNPLDPNGEKKGIWGLRIEIPIGRVSGMSMVFKPGKDWLTSSFGFRIKNNLYKYDYSFSMIKDYTPDQRLLGLGEKWIFGWDWSGEISEVGFWGEGICVNALSERNKELLEFDSVYYQITTGLDYTFQKGLHVLGEYYYNGIGKKSSDLYSFQDFLNLYTGNMSGFGKHYLMLGMDREFFYYYTLSQYILINLSDESLIYLPQLEYRITDNLLISIKAQVPAGNKKKTEFASSYPNFQFVMTGYY